MSVNPLSMGKNDAPHKKKCIDELRLESEFAFAQELNRLAQEKAETATSNREHNEFVNGLQSNFPKRLAHYENTATTTEQLAYVEMMKYFKENEKL